MTDLMTLKNMFERANIDYMEDIYDDQSEVSIFNVNTGFDTCFVFDKHGKLRSGAFRDN